MKPIILVLGLLGLTGLFIPDARSERPFWQKSWTIAAVTGGTTEERSALSSTIGYRIVMDPTQIIDPVAEDCREGVSYDDIQSRPVTELGGHFGRFWKWPNFPKHSVPYGWVRCEGSNVGAFAFIDAAHGYLFYEGGMILDLR